MYSQYNDLIANFSLILFLITGTIYFNPLDCFIRISLIKIAYWSATLVLVYYSLAYNCIL